MSDEDDRSLSGESWRRWCDRLKAVGDRILESDFPIDERARAEGYRALTRLIASATQSELEAANPDFPEFIAEQGPRSPWGGANPDFVTLKAVIDPRQTYKIWADVDGMFQATFFQHDGAPALERTRTYYERHLESFEVDEDGFLELILSPEEHAGNWIPSHREARFFTIRIVVSDWESHTAPTFHIERAGAEGEAPDPVSAAEVARGLERSIEWIEKSSAYWHRHAHEASEKAPVNTGSALSVEPGDPSDIMTGRCFWNLAEDEALLITCEVPVARYWGFAIQTMNWFESGDFARRQTSLSGDQIHLDGDGRARLVLSAQDPGVPNWIDSEGRPEGLLAYRVGWAKTSPLPIPGIERVQVEGIYARLPDDHPVITDDERRDRLCLRREALWNRFA